ncbi:exocyst complex component 1-like [Rhinatrema bivittatum]|uniref:exocyst complex component 1-like n=1 Tax=Rhinatrema bivittatum TaxID=194408 RepID=UPI001127C0D6|nr:exocyst complex component 1-like [Rhinatrema bivittatum]
MSSLVKDDLEKKLFKPEGHSLHEFIEIEGTSNERYFLCAAVTKYEDVQICMVKRHRIQLEEMYEVAEFWLLKDLELIDGKDADADNPYFDLQFGKLYSWEAYSCASKYAFARSLVKLNETYLQKDIQIVNFDMAYIEDSAIWSSNNGDCLVLMRICFYASNLLCLSLCPIP